MKMNKQQAKSLIDKYNSGNCTEAEKALIENWYVQLPYLVETPSPMQITTARDKVWGELINKRQRKMRLYNKIIKTAAAVLLIGIGIWFFGKSRNPESDISYTHDIIPGTNKATLTLANGRVLKLSGHKSGVKIEGTKLIYDDDTQIEDNNINSIEIQRLIAATPKGGTYRLLLPDGTAVWLNAATVLKFPSSFHGLKNRTVELSGEAYFEVTPNKLRPFIVKTKLQKVKVLGTHFNISGYPDDAEVTTTLLEGAVNVVYSNGEKILKPSQESLVTSNTISVKTTDPLVSTSWKNGEFSFAIEPLGSIMKKIARWYNVDIIYNDVSLAKKLFSGTISRYENISQVLRLLEVTGEVKFTIDGKKVNVKTKK